MLFYNERTLIADLAIKYKLATIGGIGEYVQAGLLLSYGPDIRDLFRRSASYVDRIIRGAKPSQLPIEQPTKFNLVINVRTANLLGVTIPPTLLARADEVIE